MKKTSKKLLTLALTLIMALALAIPSMAAITPQGYGSITVTNATKDETYAGYKIFDLTYTTTDSGEIYQSYLIATDNQFYNEVLEANDLFTLTATSDSSIFTVAPVEGKDNDIITWLNALIPEENTYTPNLTAKTATDATVVWENVPFGYYLITSSLGAAVTVNQNTPNVQIIDKNQQPGGNFTKSVGTDDVMEIGVPFTFTLTFTATNYDGETEIEQYTVTDTFPDGMNLVGTEDNVTVTVNDGTEHESTYTATLDSDRTFTVNIPWQQDGDFLYDSPATVTVTYQAVLNENAAIEGDGEANQATLTWTGNPEGSEETTTETVYTYALAIKKVNKDAEGLSGATFTLKDSDGNTVSVSEVSISENDTSANIYVVDPDGTAEIVSPKSGVIVIKGVDNAKYTLTETAAPLGYNLLKDPVEVTPVATGTSTTNTTIYLDENGTVTDVDSAVTTVTITADIPATAIAVLNSTGTELPETGGIGTTLFYVVGGALVLGAAVLLITKKRVHDAED